MKLLIIPWKTKTEKGIAVGEKDGCLTSYKTSAEIIKIYPKHKKQILKFAIRNI